MATRFSLPFPEDPAQGADPVPTKYPVEINEVTPKLATELRTRGWEKVAKSIGFTGTRKGPTDDQRTALPALLLGLRTPGALFHHGDCVGADEMAHFMAMNLGYTVHVWPPEDNKARAFTTGHHANRPRPYHVRNLSIVVHSDLLIACPRGPEDQPTERRSGTWQTIRLARRQGIPIHIIYGDGTVVEENP